MTEERKGDRMIRYRVKGIVGDEMSLCIGVIPNHKRPSIWIEKYGENYIIGSLRSDNAAHELEVMIDCMLHPEKALAQEPTEEPVGDYDYTRDDMNFDAWREGR